jgi:hypothetical protein
MRRLDDWWWWCCEFYDEASFIMSQTQTKLSSLSTSIESAETQHKEKTLVEKKAWTSFAFLFFSHTVRRICSVVSRKGMNFHRWWIDVEQLPLISPRLLACSSFFPRDDAFTTWHLFSCVVSHDWIKPSASLFHPAVCCWNCKRQLQKYSYRVYRTTFDVQFVSFIIIIIMNEWMKESHNITVKINFKSSTLLLGIVWRIR